MVAQACFEQIDDFTPSSRTLGDIKEVDRLLSQAGFLTQILSLTPLFAIFAGRSTYSAASIASHGWQISQTDWVVFSDALSATDKIARRQINILATQAAFIESGKDGQFWRCVANATK